MMTLMVLFGAVFSIMSVKNAFADKNLPWIGHCTGYCFTFASYENAPGALIPQNLKNVKTFKNLILLFEFEFCKFVGEKPREELQEENKNGASFGLALILLFFSKQTVELDCLKLLK